MLPDLERHLRKFRAGARPAGKRKWRIAIYAAYQTLNSQQIRDLERNAVADAWRKMRRKPPPGPDYLEWARNCAEQSLASLCKDHLKYRDKNESFDLDEEEEASMRFCNQSKSPDEEAGGRDTIAYLRETLPEFPPEEREVLEVICAEILASGEILTGAEIGRRLGIRRQRVQERIERIRPRLLGLFSHP